MTQILQTTRDLPKETLSFEARTDKDVQGKPVYASAASFEANVLEYDASRSGAGAEYVVNATGSRIRIPLTLYVQGDEPNVPDEDDRVTRNGRKFIVAERKPVHGLFLPASQLDHTRLKCRAE